MLTVHPTARISELADIEESIKGTGITIGEHVVIDAFVKIKPAGGSGDVTIGAYSVINSGCVLYTGNGIRIGVGVAVAANCTFAPTNHEFLSKDVPIRKQGFRPSKGGIIVQDDVWIGANCVILDGAIIEAGAVIGAGSVVRGRVGAYGIYAGQPMRKIGMRT
jgi:acetyltransferase-like isoleucine patch superfamily enzyme